MSKCTINFDTCHIDEILDTVNNIINKTIDLTIPKIRCDKPNEKIETLLSYEDKTPAKGSFVLTPTSNGTKVTWSIEIESSKNPIVSKLFGGYGYLMMKFFLGKDFGRGLENLNKACQ